MPMPRSCSARSKSEGPTAALRSSVTSPFNSRDQSPTQAPVFLSTQPVPSTRVGRRASLPRMLRAKPVVKSLTVEAGIRASSGSTLQISLPDWSAIAMPQWPGATREAVSHHVAISWRTPSKGPWACSGPATRSAAPTSRRLASGLQVVIRQRETDLDTIRILPARMGRTWYTAPELGTDGGIRRQDSVQTAHQSKMRTDAPKLKHPKAFQM